MLDLKKKVKDVNLRKRGLCIIYRVCDSANAVSSYGQRCFSVDKLRLIEQCLHSMKPSLANLDNRIDVRVAVVADNCSDRAVDAVIDTFSGCELYKANLGNARSFCACVEIGTDSRLADDDIVFMLEDDYLFLEDDVFSKMAVAFQQIGDVIQKDVGIMPDDYPDRYQNNQCVSLIVNTDVGNFMQIDSSTCTFAVMAGAFRRNKENCMKFRHWPLVGEQQSINLMWKDVSLFQPTNAMTLHSQTKQVIPRYLDFCALDYYFRGVSDYVKR